jgi:hypothetical protein
MKFSAEMHLRVINPLVLSRLVPYYSAELHYISLRLIRPLGYIGFSSSDPLLLELEVDLTKNRPTMAGCNSHSCARRYIVLIV